MRKTIIAALVLCGVGTAALADDTCTSRAADKKLAGAALKSFMGKCRKDAADTCETAAAGKKLAGAAKTSFTKKCVGDAVGG